MKEFLVRADSHPVDVSPSGRMVGPGEETGEINEKDPHNKALIEDGVLIEKEPPRTLTSLRGEAKEIGVQGYTTMDANELQDAILAKRQELAVAASEEPTTTDQTATERITL